MTPRSGRTADLGIGAVLCARGRAVRPGPRSTAPVLAPQPSTPGVTSTTHTVSGTNVARDSPSQSLPPHPPQGYPQNLSTPLCTAPERAAMTRFSLWVVSRRVIGAHPDPHLHPQHPPAGTPLPHLPAHRQIVAIPRFPHLRRGVRPGAIRASTPLSATAATAPVLAPRKVTGPGSQHPESLDTQEVIHRQCG